MKYADLIAERKSTKQLAKNMPRIPFESHQLTNQLLIEILRELRYMNDLSAPTTE